MTIDFNNPTFSISPRSDYSIYTQFFGRMIMNYNNLRYGNDEDFNFRLSANTSNERYYEFLIEDVDGMLDFDTNGYYKFELWGRITAEDEYLLDSFLVKLINNFNWSNAIEYQSNNEDNKQFTYFRE